jgi:hypothetical protein
MPTYQGDDEASTDFPGILPWHAVQNQPVNVPFARNDPNLPATVANIYRNGGYLHVFIEP